VRLFFSLLLTSLIPTAAVLADDPPAASGTIPAQVALPADVLTNEGIVQLSNAGFSDSFIVQKILLSRTRLDTTVEGLTLLRHNSVSERLIEYVMEHEAQPAVSAAPGKAPAAPTAALTHMKVVKVKLIVPVEDGPRGSGLFHKEPYYALYPSSTGSAGPAAQPAYALPAHPLLQSPAFPQAGAPVFTPAETQSLWMASR
jgi:hypothetical protein